MKADDIVEIDSLTELISLDEKYEKYAEGEN